jgi:8-oxo-dGTP pyrophosphatase MutT (NUDIX family)
VTLGQVERALARRPLEPEVPGFEKSPGGPRPAAVLCPLFEEDAEAWLILTRRSGSLRSHTGEVSFPGGRIDVGEDAASAALREAYEEIGLDPAHVKILGRLSTRTTIRNPSPITPFVGVVEGGRPSLVANPAEVELVITVRLAELFADEVHREETWELGEHGRQPFYFFELIGDTVWGATARILRELLDVVWLEAGDPEAPGTDAG